MAQFFNPANFLFRSSTQVLFQFSKFLCSIYCFLSLVGWLADVAFFLSSTPTATFQHSKHFWERLYSRPFLAWVWDPDYIQCMHTHYDCSLVHRPSHSLLFCRFQLDKNKGGKQGLAWLPRPFAAFFTCSEILCCKQRMLHISLGTRLVEP